jgi:hypothetical protein
LGGRRAEFDAFFENKCEFDALKRNNTWMLVDRPPSVRVITGKWVSEDQERPGGRWMTAP